MLIRKIHLLITIGALPLTAFGGGQDAGSLTLRDALARALRGSPDLAAFSYELRAAEARVLQASLRPNPELAYEIENPTGTGGYKNADLMENTIRLSQVIELGGKRPARVQAAKTERSLVEWDYQIRRIAVLKQTTIAFIDALAAQRRRELAEEVVRVSGDTVRLTEERASVGRGGTVETIRARVAVASAQIEIEQARRDLETARGNLAAQWGAKSADFGVVRGNLDSYDAGPSLQHLQQRLLLNPDLARWTTDRERREAALERERTLGRPDISLMAGPRVIGKGNDTTFVAGFSIPIPFNNRNQGNIAAAQQNLGKLTEEKRAAEARAFAALNEAYQKLAGARRELGILEASVIPGAKDAEQQLTEGYAAGRLTQFEVLDARRTLNTARVQQLRALADFQKARAEIDALTAAPIQLAGPVTKASPISRKK